jgi:hypothetical protein
MIILELHVALMQDYRWCVQSFLSIPDLQIRTFVDHELIKGDKFWPDALLQLNPTCREVETLDELAPHLNNRHDRRYLPAVPWERTILWQS